MGHGDGIGAHAYVGYAGFEMKVSNGCDSHPLGDNIWVSLQVCDWVYPTVSGWAETAVNRLPPCSGHARDVS